MAFSSPPPSPVLEQLRQLMPLIVLILAAPMLAKFKRRKGVRRAASKRADLHIVRPRNSIAEPAKLSALERAKTGKFSKKRLFNRPESKIFKMLEHEIDNAQLPLRVMGQTSLSAFLKTDGRYGDSGSFLAINGRYSDFVVVDGEGNVRFVVEYHGEGHHQGNSEVRDAIKSIVFDKAGIPLLVLKAGESDHLARLRIRHELGIGE
ncbi:MAG: DUF2726 domain-containing protein [Parvularculaceae bacterium]